MIQTSATNEQLRERINAYTEDSGVTLKYIAEQLKIPYAYFCGWKSGARRFGQARLNKVEAWLDTVNTDNDDDIVVGVLDLLEEAILDKRPNGLYKIMETDNKGTQIKQYNREQYLEFMIDVAITRLGFHSSLDSK